MLKKSIGFNWGPCSTSCSYWTGVRLRDLLIYAGVKVGHVRVSAVSIRSRVFTTHNPQLATGACACLGRHSAWEVLTACATGMGAAHEHRGWRIAVAGSPVVSPECVVVCVLVSSSGMSASVNARVKGGGGSRSKGSGMGKMSDRGACVWGSSCGLLGSIGA